MWNAIKNALSGSISTVIEKSGEAIDRLVTSDEERLALKNELVKIQQQESELARKHVIELESQVTERHANDMKSDSWLSKNIRPLAMGFLTIAVTLLAYVTTFSESAKTEVLQQWIELFTYLLGLVYGFYFGSRGLEKIAAIIKK